MMKVLVLVLCALLPSLTHAVDESTLETSAEASISKAPISTTPISKEGASVQENSVQKSIAPSANDASAIIESVPELKADNLALFAGAAQDAQQSDDNFAQQTGNSSSLNLGTTSNSLVSPSSPDIYGQLSTMMMGLCLVLFVIFALAWVVKKLNLPMTQQAGKLQIVSTLPLSNKEKILLIEVRGQELLIGVTANNISLLSELPAQSITELISEDDDSTESSGEPAVGQKKESDFAKKLYQVLSKGNLK